MESHMNNDLLASDDYQQYLAPIDIQSDVFFPLSPASAGRTLAPTANLEYQPFLDHRPYSLKTNSNRQPVEMFDQMIMSPPVSAKDFNSSRFSASPPNQYSSTPPMKYSTPPMGYALVSPDQSRMNMQFTLSPPLTISASPEMQFGDAYQESYEYQEKGPIFEFMGQMENSDEGYNASMTQQFMKESDSNAGLWDQSNQNQNQNQYQYQQEWRGEEGLLQCSFPGCPKTFTKQTNLKSHSRIHISERNYACEECGSSFRRSHDLKRHQRSLHSDLKPFGCSRCGKKFSRMVHL